jgi:hypothetical protein
MSRSNMTRIAVAAVLLSAGVMGSIVASQRTASAMAKASTALLDSLTQKQRQKMATPFDSADRTRWNFIPTNMFPRQGLPLKEMTEPQRKLAHDLLKSALSQRGYTTTTAVMNDLEAILRDTEAAARAAAGKTEGGNIRDPEPRCSARLETRARGAGASKGTTYPCTSRSPVPARWRPRRASGARTPPKCAKDRRRDSGRSTRSRTRAARS